MPTHLCDISVFVTPDPHYIWTVEIKIVISYSQLNEISLNMTIIKLDTAKAVTEIVF